MERRKSKKIQLANTFIGGDSPILVQSMLNIPASDIEGSVQQAKELASAGCQVIRFAIPNEEALNLIEPIKNAVDVPLVADIHFDYKLALGAAERGIDKIRINPGNIGDDSRVKAVADACRQKNIPIRIGVNSGSLEKHILAKYGAPTPEAMVESALYHANLLEKFDLANKKHVDHIQTFKKRKNPRSTIMQERKELSKAVNLYRSSLVSEVLSHGSLPYLHIHHPQIRIIPRTKTVKYRTTNGSENTVQLLGC